MPCVAVDEDLVLALGSSLEYDRMHYLENVKEVIRGWHFEILPIEVVVLDPGIHEFLGRICEARARNYAVSAVGMLSRLLQIDNCRDTLLPELLDDAIFLY